MDPNDSNNDNSSITRQLTLVGAGLENLYDEECKIEFDKLDSACAPVEEQDSTKLTAIRREAHDKIVEHTTVEEAPDEQLCATDDCDITIRRLERTDTETKQDNQSIKSASCLDMFYACLGTPMSYVVPDMSEMDLGVGVLARPGDATYAIRQDIAHTRDDASCARIDVQASKSITRESIIEAVKAGSALKLEQHIKARLSGVNPALPSYISYPDNTSFLGMNSAHTCEALAGVLTEATQRMYEHAQNTDAPMHILYKFECVKLTETEINVAAEWAALMGEEICKLTPAQRLLFISGAAPDTTYHEGDADYWASESLESDVDALLDLLDRLEATASDRCPTIQDYIDEFCWSEPEFITEQALSGETVMSELFSNQ